MGRKNKTKLLKHANIPQSPTPSGTGDTSLVANAVNAERQPLEVVKANLREIVTHSPTEGNQRLLCLFSELEKKSAELDVAKKLIRQLQENSPVEFAHGDIGAELDQENVHPNDENVQQVELLKASIEPELDQIGRKVVILSEDRIKLEEELEAARGNVLRLEGEVKLLESKLEKTNDFLQQGEQKSAEVQSNLKLIIQELETALETSNQKVKDSQSNIASFQANIDELTSGKALQAKLYQELNERLKTREIESLAEKEKELAAVNAKLDKERTLREQQQVSSADANSRLEKAQSEIESLRKLEVQLSECTKSRDEALKTSSRLEKDISDLKAAQETGSLALNKKIAELDAERKVRENLEAALSETTAKLNQEKGNQQETLQDVEKKLDAAQNTIAELTASLGLKSTDLESALDRERLLKETFETRFVNINNGVQLIKKDFHEVKTDLVKVRENNQDLQLQLTASKADAKHYRDDADNCRKCIKKLEEHFKSDMDLETGRVAELQEKLTSIQGVFQLESSENLLESLQKLKSQLEAAETEKKKMGDELFTIRNLIKKVRKERDGSAKKWKKLLDEVTAEKNALLGKTSELEKRLNESADSSVSDDSIRSISEQSETYRSQCEELQEAIQQLGQSSKDAEQKIEQLSKLLVDKEKENLDAHRTLVAQQTKIADFEKEGQKTSTKLESRIVELQRSAENWQKRYDEDMEQLRQKLETSNSALEVQQEMNAQLTAQSDEVRQNISRMQETQVKLAETAKNTIEGIEKEKLEALEALRVCKVALDESEKEVARIQELERTKTDVLVNATEEEKTRIRKEFETIKLELETAQTAFKEQKVESKKHFDNEMRKVKKLLKAAEEQKTTIESKIAELEDKLKVETAEAETLRAQAQNKDVDIEQALLDMAQELERREQAVLEMAQELERREKEHQSALDAERNTAAEEKSDLELKQSLLEKEIEYVAKKLEEATKKDKVAQLENRLEVIQTAAKAQQKRLEDELAKTKASLEATVAEKNEELEKRVTELQTQKDVIEELKMVKASETEQSVLTLEQQIKDLQAENAAERTGLVDELIATKQKIEEFEKAEAAHQANLERVQTLEKQLKTAQTALEKSQKSVVSQKVSVDNMVPSLDAPPLQLPPFFAENPTVLYGLLGFIAYFVLLHIYLLL